MLYWLNMSDSLIMVDPGEFAFLEYSCNHLCFYLKGEYVMWILAIIGIFIIYELITEHKEAKKNSSKAKQFDSKSTSNSFGYPYGSYNDRLLCRKYENAIASHNNDEILKIIDEMTGNHWARSYSSDDDDYESACLYEWVAHNCPYVYPANGPRVNYRGLSLEQIFGNQNVEIRARKEGKAPYTTPLPYKHK